MYLIIALIHRPANLVVCLLGDLQECLNIQQVNLLENQVEVQLDNRLAGPQILADNLLVLPPPQVDSQQENLVVNLLDNLLSYQIVCLLVAQVDSLVDSPLEDLPALVASLRDGQAHYLLDNLLELQAGSLQDTQVDNPVDSPVDSLLIQVVNRQENQVDSQVDSQLGCRVDNLRGSLLTNRLVNRQGNLRILVVSLLVVRLGNQLHNPQVNLQILVLDQVDAHQDNQLEGQRFIPLYIQQLQDSQVGTLPKLLQVVP